MSRFGLLAVVVVPNVLVVSVALSLHLVSGLHIADVNILLPPKMTHFVEYRLQGSDGCFKWSWDHHDILSVLPEFNSSGHCTTSERLRSIAPYSGRKETAVYATDVLTGMVIDCKVYIDNFSRIQIFHNSIKLDSDGLATLHVHAFDDEENVFSSLVGLQFMWHLMPEANGLPHHLVHFPLKDSPLSDSGGLCVDLDIQTKLEDSGVFSDLYVVKGTGIGHEIVSVHLLELQFEHMADKIVLTVAEAMSLDPPSPVFVLVNISFFIGLCRGNFTISFSRWSVLNSLVAQVDTMMGFGHALSLGVTSVIVEDARVAGHTQMSSPHVVVPDTLHLYMLPLSHYGDPIDETNPIPSVSRWYVVSGRNYLILMKVFSRGPGAKEIYITENDDVELHDDQSGFWNTLPISDDIAVLKVVQEIMVCDQVNFIINGTDVVTQSILLPWAPTVYQELEIKATGVSSDCKWSSTDMGVVSVSTYGVVQAKKPGKATIKVVSNFDPFNYDESTGGFVKD
ncbi:Nuclear pore complex protein GP210 [Camellia lanceoleosa]|nr:Nuclear pore complex protein GP210 [Camellia lanceoleosa]